MAQDDCNFFPYRKLHPIKKAPEGAFNQNKTIALLRKNYGINYMNNTV